MLYQCFEQSCELEVQYVCQCLSVDTYSCEFHLAAHLKLPDRTHSFDSILVESPEGTKDAILTFLKKEKSRINKLKEILSTLFRPNICNSRKCVEEALSKLDSDLEKIKSLIEKISQTPKQEQEQYYSLRTDTDIDGDTAPELSETFNSDKLWRHCKLGTKKCLILNRPNNTQLEQEFRRACLQYESQVQGSKLSVSQAFQDHTDVYHQITSLYLIGQKDKKTNLFIYDTESGTEQAKTLKIHWEWEWPSTSLVQLPIGELFCITESTQAYIIDRNYEVRVLSSEMGVRFKTAIHFKGSAYCFGSQIYTGIPQSIRFDLDKNHWFALTSMPQHHDCMHHSVIFNEKILICANKSKNLLLYSIDIDSFTTVPYDFDVISGKILINEVERVYLIECPGFIYESEVLDVYNWQKTAESIINQNLDQVYCSYIKGEIYISTMDEFYNREYYRFDLDQKTLTEVAYYSSHIAFKSTNSKLEAIGCHSETFKLYSEHVEGYFKKGHTLWDLGRKIGAIEYCNDRLRLNPNDYRTYSIKLNALDDIGMKNEVIECYNEIINLNPSYPYAHYNKGVFLMDLGRSHEAMECLNKAIELSPNNFKFFCYRAYILNDLGKEKEALENFNRVHDWVQEMRMSEEISGIHSLEAWQDRIELARKLCELQRSTANFKKEIHWLKSVFSENSRMLKEIEEKEAMVKVQHSQLLKRAVECLSTRCNRTELIHQIEEDVELQKSIIITFSQLRADSSNSKV